MILSCSAATLPCSYSVFPLSRLAACTVHAWTLEGVQAVCRNGSAFICLWATTVTSSAGFRQFPPSGTDAHPTSVFTWWTSRDSSISDFFITRAKLSWEPWNLSLQINLSDELTLFSKSCSPVPPQGSAPSLPSEPRDISACFLFSANCLNKRNSSHFWFCCCFYK